jgi:hypothetical protein
MCSKIADDFLHNGGFALSGYRVAECTRLKSFFSPRVSLTTFPPKSAVQWASVQAGDIGQLRRTQHPILLYFILIKLLRHYAAFPANLRIELSVSFKRRDSSSISKSSCSPSQNLADTPKYFERRSAVSAVTARFPLIMAEIRGWGMPVSFECR